MKRKIITVALAALVGVGLGAALGFGPLLRYKSEGILSMEMGTAEYKRFTELANDETTIRQFLAVSQPTKLNDKDLERLVADIVKGEWHKPVAKVSKADAKELPDIVLQMEKEVEKEKERETAKEKSKLEDKNAKKTNIGVLAYLGLKVTAINAEPNTAAEIAGWLGRYFKDVATHEAIREQVTKWVSENKQASDQALQLKLKFQFDIDQAKERSASLTKVFAKYPELMGSREGRQIVEIRKDNEKFLSPHAQIVAAESEVIDANAKIKKLDREMAQQAFVEPLIKNADAVVKATHSGLEMMGKLNAILLQQAKNLKNDAEREKLLSLTADLSQINARFVSQAEFIAQPSIPSHAERPTPALLMLVVGLLFAFLAALFCWRHELLTLIRENEAALLDKPTSPSMH